LVGNKGLFLVEGLILNSVVALVITEKGYFVPSNSGKKPLLGLLRITVRLSYFLHQIHKQWFKASFDWILGTVPWTLMSALSQCSQQSWTIN
jgi:hypothetical protein